RPHRFTMLSAAGKVVHEVLVEAKAPVRGQFDRLEVDGLSGWAVNDLEPGRPVELDVLLDGRHWLTLQTSELRKDLLAKGMGGEVAGFRVAWPIGLLPAGTQVEIRSLASGEALGNGTRAIPAGHGAPAASTYLDQYGENRIRPV